MVVMVVLNALEKRGKNAREAESKILEEFKYAKWKGPKLLKSGNSELFQVDILEKDNY